jgi:hypothetical protein
MQEPIWSFRRDNHYQFFYSPDSSAVLGSSDWSVIGKLAIIFTSLSTSEVENEHVISMIKQVVGERGGRSKNELVTVHMQIYLSSLQEHGDDE